MLVEALYLVLSVFVISSGCSVMNYGCKAVFFWGEGVKEESKQHVFALGDDERLVSARQMAKRVHAREWTEVCAVCVAAQAVFCSELLSWPLLYPLL